VFSAIQAECTNLFDTLNLIWRVVDVTLSLKGQKHQEPNYALVCAIVRGLPPVANLDSLVEIASQLAPTQRRKFLLVLNSIRWFYQYRNDLEAQATEFSAGDIVRERRERMRSMRTYLSHFLKYLEAYDPDSAARFADRKKNPADHRGIADHMTPAVETAEKGGNWLKG
jgi:hypothetical protein